MTCVASGITRNILRKTRSQIFCQNFDSPGLLYEGVIPERLQKREHKKDETHEDKARVLKSKSLGIRKTQHPALERLTPHQPQHPDDDDDDDDNRSLPDFHDKDARGKGSLPDFHGTDARGKGRSLASPLPRQRRKGGGKGKDGVPVLDDEDDHHVIDDDGGPAAKTGGKDRDHHGGKDGGKDRDQWFRGSGRDQQHGNGRWAMRATVGGEAGGDAGRRWRGGR